MTNSFTSEGRFKEGVAELATNFAGPVSIVAAAAGAAPPLLDAGLSILVPISGTEASRRGAEVAFALARPTGAMVIALYVSSAASDLNRLSRRSAVMRAEEEAVLKDISNLGERYDAVFRTAIELHTSADKAILRYASRNKCGLIVMGVSRRPGDQFFFGKTSSAVLSGWKGSTILVAS